MAARHVVVDGSNLATEGRSMPSLAQLDRAVREFLLENPEDVVTVVVDASFGHRIDASEFKVFEEAEAAGEVVSPPAGAIGRGDAFLLRIADKTGATVLSNDSFQEFHGDYDWLFERGRLIGGKPVPGVGWIFTPRTPVRGPRSREAVKEAKRKTKAEPESAVPGLDLAAARSRTQGKGKKNVERAIAVALEEVVAPKDKPRRRRKGGEPPADPVNDPLSFITFIAAHPLGGEVTATVESFASHGAFVDCQGARCYVPLSAMGEPPPKSAREMFTKGEQVKFVVQALDPQRRGVELALPGFAKIAGAPTEETVAAEIESRADEDAREASDAVAPPAVRRTRKKAAPAEAAVASGSDVPDGQVSAPAMKAAPRRRGARAPSEAAAEAAGEAADVAEVDVAAAVAAEAAVVAAPEGIPAKKAAPRRRASQPTTAVAPEVAVAPDAVTADVVTAAKTSARRRASAATPRGPAKTTTEVSVPEVVTPDVVTPEVMTPEVMVPTKKAASRRRGTAVVSAPAANSVTEAAPGTTAVLQSVPRRRPRKVAAVAVEIVQQEPTLEPSPVKKATPRRRGPRQESDSPAPVLAAPNDGGVASPARTRSRRATKGSAIAASTAGAGSTTVDETIPPEPGRRRAPRRTENPAPTSQAVSVTEPRSAKRSPAKKAGPQVPTPSSP